MTRILSVAPMMAYTDRHCRYLHRLFAPSALLFTEMVSTGSLIHGKQWQQFDYHPAEHPVALQLGGSDPRDLAACTRAAHQRGYDEVNLNVGCPSPRVQSATFGACLMKTPGLVAECIRAMVDASPVAVTVKCRLGVDDHDSDEQLEEFISHIREAGCGRVYIHARKAWLTGLSPAQNRNIPPLQPERAKRVKQAFPDLQIIVNGGISDVATARDHLSWADGIMLGRSAYQTPLLLSSLEKEMFNPDFSDDAERVLPEVLAAYRHYIENELAQGTALRHVARQALNIPAGFPGARRYRRVLSDSTHLRRNHIDVFDEAVANLHGRAA